jgi:hypothetical protein
VMRYTTPAFPSARGMVEASELKCTFTLEDIPELHYCLVRPMVIEIQKDGTVFVVSQPDTGAFAYDRDLSRALDGFYKVFTNQFEFMKRNAENLSPSLQNDLRIYQNLLKSC